MVRDEDIRLCLAAVSRALTGDGKFAFETRNPAARPWESWDSAYRDEITDPAGRRVRMGTRIDEPFNGETITFTHTFTSPAWPAPKTSTSTLRFLGPEGLESRLREAGLKVEAQYGDWDKSPLTDKSPEIITLARRV